MKINDGISPIIAAADIISYKGSSNLKKPAKITVKGCEFKEEENISGIKKLLQVLRKDIMRTDDNAGAIMGSKTFLKLESLEQPSMKDASSISLGKASKKVLISHESKGTRYTRCKRHNPTRVSSSLRSFINEYN